jgi:pimeloyl-ACP methyl ester carboxylesterase
VFEQFQSEKTLFEDTSLGEEPESRTLELSSPDGPIRIRYWDSGNGGWHAETEASASAKPHADGVTNRQAEASATAKPTTPGVVGRAAPLLLTHGLFDSKRAWRYVWWPLAAGRRVVAPDLPGMGLSDKPKLRRLPRAERYTPQWLAAMLVQFADAVGGLDELVLVGHSLGGAVALLSLMDEAFAGRVRALVLVAAAGYPQQLPPYVVRYQGWRGAVMACPLWHDRLAAWALRRGRAERGVEAAYRLCVHDLSAVPREALEASLDVVRSPGFPYAARHIARRLVPRDHAALVERFSEIAVPVLVIWGRNDRVVPPANAARFGRDLPNARVVMLDACGHWPQYEKARETAREIERFVEEHVGAGRPVGE